MIDPNADATKIFMEYVRMGRNHHGGLVAACRDVVTLFDMVMRAKPLIDALEKLMAELDGDASQVLRASALDWLFRYNTMKGGKGE